VLTSRSGIARRARIDAAFSSSSPAVRPLLSVLCTSRSGRERLRASSAPHASATVLKSEPSIPTTTGLPVLSLVVMISSLCRPDVASTVPLVGGFGVTPSG
jgi:hypothetical protein